MDSMMAISTESGTGEPSSNSRLVDRKSHHYISQKCIASHN